MKLVVVPDSDRVEQWLIDSASTGRGDFIDLRQVCTLGQLVERCEPARWSGLAPADPLLVRLVLASHAQLAERAFGPAARTPDFAGHVHEVLSHLRAQHVTPRQLTLAAESVDERLAARTHALVALWNALDATLKNRGLVDRAELVRVAARRLREEGLPPRLRGFREVEVRHVHDLFPARLELLEAFATACHEADVALQLWWPSTGQQQADLFVLDAVRAIEARWQTLSAEAFADLSAAPLSWVTPAAFSDAPIPRAAPELTAFSAPTPRDEARQIAARVKTLVSAGVPPERIAVAFRELADDTEALVEALADVDVPARARLGVPLLASAPGRLALSLFDLVDEGFPADDLAALLESRLVAVLPVEAAAPRRAFLEAGLRDDLVGATAKTGAYEVRLASLERRARTREPLAILRTTVADVLRLVRQIPDEGRATELLEAWWDTLTRLGVFSRLSSRPDPLPARQPLLTRELDRALARDQAAGDALLGLLASLKQALHASGLGERRMKRRDFARHVRRAAQDLNVNARGPRTGAVWLLDARELAGRSFEVVFLGGLVDGRMPGRAPPLPLLTEDDRAALNASGKASLFRLSVGDSGLRLSVKLAEDRLLLHLALCAGQRVVLSRSRLDAAGRELLGSPFRDALARAVEGLREVAVARVSVPPLDQVQSEGELRARAALELICPPDTRQTAQDPRVPGLEAMLGAEPWLLEARHTSAMEIERLRIFGDPGRASGQFSGQLDASVMAPLLEQLRFDAAHPVSAAQFNVWAGCAFHGLSRFVLGLDALEAAGEEADARVRGTFWHDVLRTLVPVLDRQGLLGRNDAPLAQVHAAIDEAVASAAKEAEASSPVGHPALWELTRLRTATVMRRLVASEVIAPFPHTRVLEVEAEFGTSRATVAALREVKLPGVRAGERDVYLRGQIDRVDQGDGVAGIIDYKTSLRSRGDLLGAVLTSDFQLPFYLLAVATWLPDAQLQALWLDMRRREVRRAEELLKSQSLRSLVATDAATRDQLELEGRPNLANRVHQVLGALREGDFGARPVDCTFCKMRPVCRISSKRLGGG
jgi:hypothetical protein